MARILGFVGVFMALIEDAKQVLLKAWSVRMAALSALFSGLQALTQVLPFLDGIFPHGVLAGLAALAALGAIGSRIIDQPNSLPKP